MTSRAAAVDSPEGELLAKIAALLFVNGQTTEGTRIAVESFGTQNRREIRLIARWGELTVLSDGARSRSTVIAEPVAVDIGRVESVERIAEDLRAGRIGEAETLATLEAIAHRPPVTLARFAAMAAAGAAALGIIFGAVDALTLALIAGSAGAGAFLRRGVSHLGSNPFTQPFLAALLAGAIGSAAKALDFDVSHQLVAVCPCMVLVPGPHFLNGTIDLARARMALGIARFGFASLIVLAISAGLLAGLSIDAASLTGGGASPPVPLALDAAAAGVAVAAYGSFFNMPWRILPLPIGIGMLAHALRWTMLGAGASVQTGAFGACLLVGTVVAPLAHRLRLPFGAFAFASVVSLMPGIFMFQAASKALVLIAPAASGSSAVLLGFLRDGATSAIILLAMTGGLIIPKMVLDGLLTRRIQQR